ncbi:hypothetical protein [Terasakiella sp. SH-1]|uniref:hypothetical protein n=1 Tax=Terasakiella sp. SH-1 TaxID=2560057 RepID=UPI0010738570|nr:hypothetical protein [Terasakiella sp. SH-1]
MTSMLLVETSVLQMASRKAQGGVSIYTIADSLRDVLEKEAGVEISDLFARPSHDEEAQRIDWYCPKGAVKKYTEIVDAEEKRLFEEELHKKVSKVTVLIERFENSEVDNERALAEFLDEALKIPSREYIYSVDGKPVFAAWGFEGRAADEIEDLSQYADLKVDDQHSRIDGGEDGDERPTDRVSEEEGRDDEDEWAKGKEIRAKYTGPKARCWWCCLLLPLLLFLLGLFIGRVLCFCFLTDFQSILSGQGSLNSCIQQSVTVEVPPIEGPEPPGRDAPRNEIEVPDPPIMDPDPRLEDPGPPFQDTEPPLEDPEPPLEEALLKEKETIENEIDDRREREGGKVGQITVSLSWDTKDDLDLYIACPAVPDPSLLAVLAETVLGVSETRTIYYGSLTACGGTLDVDMNYKSVEDSPVENVTFPDRPDVPGTYTVYVSNNGDRDPVGQEIPFSLIVKKGDDTDLVQGVIDKAGRKVEVTSFIY